jgi:anti-sigma factor (TIGR02949 family)
MQLSCEDVATLLTPFVDGEFDAAEGAQIEAHLGGCHACARSARLQSAFKQTLRRSGGPSAAPEGLREAVLARLLDAEDPEQGSAQTFWAWVSRRLTPRTVAFTAAAGGIAAWLIAGGLQHPLLQADADRRVFAEQAHAALDDGIAIHARTLPLDYTASDAGSVQRWLQGRLDFGVQLPRFAPQKGPPPALQGVRLSTLHSRPAAVISYLVPAVEGRRVSLVIMDDPDPQMAGAVRQLQGRKVWLTQARGFNVASWRSHEIVYSLISDLDESDVLELVRAAEVR